MPALTGNTREHNMASCLPKPCPSWTIIPLNPEKKNEWPWLKETRALTHFSCIHIYPAIHIKDN